MNMNTPNEDELYALPMQILIRAGDARLLVKQALEDMGRYDFAAATEKLDDAQNCIGEAHGLQTSLIQREARGEGQPLTLIFTHAQDTLMTIFSELNIARSLLGVFRGIDERLRKVEEGREE